MIWQNNESLGEYHSQHPITHLHTFYIGCKCNQYNLIFILFLTYLKHVKEEDLPSDCETNHLI